jgi:hypothetical protein
MANTIKTKTVVFIAVGAVAIFFVAKYAKQYIRHQQDLAYDKCKAGQSEDYKNTNGKGPIRECQVPKYKRIDAVPV